MGLLAGLLPLLAAAVLARTRYRLIATRVLDPVRVEVGQTARVTLRLRNASRVPTGTMMLEDSLPYSLGERPRLVLERLLGGGSSAVTYTVRADRRGKYDIGPLIVRITDPFGLIELTRTYPSTDHLTATPRIVRLPAVRLPGEYTGHGDNRSRAVAVHGTTTRPHVSTGTATICAGFTGSRRHVSGNSWCGVKSNRGILGRSSP